LVTKTKYLLKGEIGMKRKILACVVACATLFLGMGYAFWTNSLQINTTADTGELKVKFVDLDYFGAYGDENGWAVYTGKPRNEELATSIFDDAAYNKLADNKAIQDYWKGLAKYTKSTFSAIQVSPSAIVEPPQVDSDYRTGTNMSDTIKINTTDMYPGYAQLFRTDILNAGTIAAKLADVKIDYTGNPDQVMKDMIGVSLKVVYEDGTNVDVLNPTGNNYFTIDNVKFVKLSALDNANWLKGADNLLYVFPGDNDKNTMDAIFGVAMDPDYAGANTTGHIVAANHSAFASGKSDAASQNKAVDFTMKFLWDQFNTETPYED
jgi:hypothetical protein